MADLTFSTSLRNAAVTGVTDRIDSGASVSAFKFYAAGAGTAGRPATPDTAITDQTLLGTVSFSATAYNSSTGGTATASGLPLSGASVAAGDITFVRIVDGDGSGVIDSDVGVSGSGAGVLVNNLTVVYPGTISITSHSLTFPAGSS